MIRIENLTKSYRTPAGRHYVFKNLHVEFPANKSVALIGRNGSGKSTLLRVIGGIDRPDSGKVITVNIAHHVLGVGVPVTAICHVLNSHIFMLRYAAVEISG